MGRTARLRVLAGFIGVISFLTGCDDRRPPGLNNLTVNANDTDGHQPSNSPAVISPAPVAEPSADTTAPDAPAGLQAAAVSTSQINLGWAAASDNVAIVGYRLQRCQNAGCTSFRQIGTTSGASYS